MQAIRPSFGIHPRGFGKRARPSAAQAAVMTASRGQDLKLFASTFAGGFLFVSLLLA